jgi:hypothetical protein
MAIRVPAPDIQGAQRLGGMQAQAAATPFQRLTLPDTTFNSRMLQQLGESGIQFANYRQEQEDERLLLELQAGVGAWERSLLFGEDVTGAPTGQGGVLALQERDAFGLTQRVEADFDKHLAQYNETLTGLSRNGRQAAQAFAQSRRDALLDQTARFEFQQREAYNNRLRREAAAAAARAAETAWASPEAMAAGEARLISATTNRATHEFAGIPDETERQRVIDEAVAAELEQFHRTAILRAVGQGQTKVGRRLYDEAVERKTITLEEDDLLTRTVQYGEQIDVVINGASMIFQQYPDDLAGATQAARSMGLDGDTERDLVAEIERRFSSAAAVEAQQREQTFEAARQAAISGTLFQDLDAGQLAQFTPGQRADLEALNGGSRVIGDNELYRSIRLLSAPELATYDLASVVGRLNTSQWETLLADQRAARNAMAGTNNYEWQGIRTEQTTIDATITAMGIPAGANAREDDLANRNQIYLLIEGEKQRRLAAGEAWDVQAIARYADFLNTPVVTSEGVLYGVNTAPRWRVLLGQEIVQFVPGVPEDVIPAIRQAIEARGLPATPELIQQVYTQSQAATE